MVQDRDPGDLPSSSAGARLGRWTAEVNRVETTRQDAYEGGGVELGGVAQVSLLVRDTGRADEFYRTTLGLRHLFTAGDLTFLDAGGTRLYLHRTAEDQWRPGSILYFLVDDIDATYAALDAQGVTTTGAPHRVWTDDASGHEEWMAFFEDPDGNTLALLSRKTPAG